MGSSLVRINKKEAVDVLIAAVEPIKEEKLTIINLDY